MVESIVVASSRRPCGTGQRLSTTMEAIAKVSLLGLAAAAVYSFYRNLRLLVSTWSPALEDDSQSDRARRLAEVQVANVFQRFSGVRVYQLLRIPDSRNRGRKEVDLILLTNRKMYVVEIKNWSGSVKLDADGTWCQVQKNGTIQKHPNVVEDTQYRAALLESYIARRGVTLPSTFLQYKVLLVNSECRVDESILLQPEVLSFDQWESLLAKEAKKGVFNWMKAMLPKKKKEVLADSLHKQLQFILSTTPTWDRLEMEGGRTVLGDFLHFKGRAEDEAALKFVKRSHVACLSMSHQRQWMLSILGFSIGVSPEVQVSCTRRDYRLDISKQSRKDDKESKLQVTVRPDMEVVFQAIGNKKAQQFKINHVTAIVLSP